MMISILLLALGPVLPAAAAPVAGDISLDTVAGQLTFANEPLELRFDLTTGELRQIVYLPWDGRLLLLDNAEGAAVCDANVAGKWLSGAGASPWRYEKHEVEQLPGGAALHITSSLNGWRLRATYRLWQRDAALARSAAFIPPEGVSGRISGLRLMLPGLKLTDPASTVYAQLSNYPPTRQPFSALSPGRVVDEQNSGLSGHFVLLHDSKAGLCVPITYFSDQEYSLAQVVEGQGSITVIGHQQAIADPQPGQEIAFGSQLLLVTSPDWHAGLQGCQELYDHVGLTPPERTLEAAAKTVMYSAHPGGTIDSGFQDVGGFREFAKMLPYYHDLGINMLWLLPIWHGYVYAPDDYSRLDPRLGTEEELKALVDQAHSLGIRVLCDLIPHGPLDTSKLHEQHPDWICKNEDGSFQYWWGCLYTDYAHPGWQGFMADHATDWVKRVGIDGYRVDCAGGGPPNWHPYDGNRPTTSGLAGGLSVLAAARQKMETAKPDVFLLAEAGGPPFFRSANFTYNWAFAFTVTPDLPRVGAAHWAPQAAEWLEWQRYTYPRGAKQIMFLENHDTARALLRLGVGTQRALLALCAFGDGTPFLYHDQEIGYGPYLKQLYAIRPAHDELTLGDTSYTAIPSSDPAVLTILRTQGDRRAVVAISFAGEPRVCKLELDRCPGLDPKTRYTLWDAFAERSLPENGRQGLLPADMKSVGVSLDPYSPAVILIRPVGQLPTKREAPAPARLLGRMPKVVRAGNRIMITNGIYQLQIGPDAGGLIESLGTTGPGARALLGPTVFASPERRLWLGGDLRLGPGTFLSLDTTERNDEVTVVARGVVTRTIGGKPQPALEYEARYVCGTGPEVKCALRLTPQVNITGVLGSLATTLAFPNAARWTANTVEGLLYDDLVTRRSSDLPYQALYAHPHSDRLFASQSIPLDPDRGFIGAGWPDGTLLLVRDIRGWAAGVPQYVMVKERLKDDPGLHAILAWADGTRPLSLAKGQTYELTHTLLIARGGEAAVNQAALVAGSAGAIDLRAEGSRYVVETPVYRAAFGRSRGGSLDELALKGMERTAIAGTNVYSDYGIYPEWTDPSGNKQRTTAPANEDVEPDVTIDRQPDHLRLTFSGLLRSPNAFGRGIASPPTQYRATYDFSVGRAVGVECAVRPNLVRSQLKAFLSQTVLLPSGGAWAVYTGEQPGVAAAGTPPGPGDRVWQSLTQHVGEADRPRVLVELPGPVCAEFSDFIGLKDVQNLFYLQGRADSVLFAAFLDGQPEDIHPRWRAVRYNLALHRGALVDVAQALGLPLPQEGVR